MGYALAKDANGRPPDLLTWIFAKIKEKVEDLEKKNTDKEDYNK